MLIYQMERVPHTPYILHVLQPQLNSPGGYLAEECLSDRMFGMWRNSIANMWGDSPLRIHEIVDGTLPQPVGYLIAFLIAFLAKLDYEYTRASQSHRNNRRLDYT